MPKLFHENGEGMLLELESILAEFGKMSLEVPNKLKDTPTEFERIFMEPFGLPLPQERD